MTTVRRTVQRGAITMIVLVASMIPASLTSAGEQSGLAQVRRATAAYHNIDAAEAAGYHEFLDCFDKPGVGGMGQHYANVSLIDGIADANEPEVLVYEVTSHGPKLAGVEYVIPQSAWTSADPPRLFGTAFDRNDTLEIWALHAWIWQPNPSGIFTGFNPSVSMCP